MSPERLALCGGTPLRRPGDWPKWPIYDEGTIVSFRRVLESRRWSPCGFYLGDSPREKAFAESFARYHGVPYGIAAPSGSVSLLLALEALDVGCGDEVIVPGLTWVAPATSVVNVNAIPILTDVDPDTCCLDVAAVERNITDRTRAIIGVHLYSSMIDLDALMALSERRGIPVIEDCAQTHGSVWGESMAGSVGALGVFSMTHGKTMTSGEGGAVITKEKKLFDRLEQLRMDGRRYMHQSPTYGRMELEEVGELLGTNYTMTDFQAVLLLEGLARLDEQIARRRKNAQRLDDELGKLEGLRPISRPDRVTRQSYYHYFVHLEPAAFAGRPNHIVCEALSQELGIWAHPAYPPLNEHRLYNPRSKRRYRISDAHWDALDPRRFDLPVARSIHEKSAVLHHSVLLGDDEHIEVIVEAFRKVMRHAEQLPVQ